MDQLRSLGDDDLLARLDALVRDERGCVAEVVRHIMEADEREIVVDRGYMSMFDYCRKKLAYSEAAAFSRIRAARACRRFPRVLEELRSGALHLEGICRLYPVLTDDNCGRVLDRAKGASKREILALAAELGAEPVVERDTVRFLAPPAAADRPPAAAVAQTDADCAVAGREELPLADSGSPSSSPDGPSLPGEATGRKAVASQPGLSEPAPVVLAPPRVRLSFTADLRFLELVDRLRALRRHKFPEGRLEDLLRDALETILSELEPLPPGRDSRKPKSERPRPWTRFVPRSVKKTVWRRDGGRCAFVGTDGRRCEATEFLEYDHIVPWALGGSSDVANIRLLCRGHNQRLARRRFGKRVKNALH